MDTSVKNPPQCESIRLFILKSIKLNDKIYMSGEKVCCSIIYLFLLYKVKSDATTLLPITTPSASTLKANDDAGQSQQDWNGLLPNYMSMLNDLLDSRYSMNYDKKSVQV